MEPYGSQHSALNKLWLVVWEIVIYNLLDCFLCKEYKLYDISCTLKTPGHFLVQRKPKPVLHYALQKKVVIITQHKHTARKEFFHSKNWQSKYFEVGHQEFRTYILLILLPLCRLQHHNAEDCRQSCKCWKNSRSLVMVLLRA